MAQGTGLYHDAINEAAMKNVHVFLKRLFPNKSANKKVLSKEFKERSRSFSRLEINAYNCKWRDNATGDKGDTPISLFAHLVGIPEAEAARSVARIVGIGAAKTVKGVSNANN